MRLKLGDIVSTHTGQKPYKEMYGIIVSNNIWFNEEDKPTGCIVLTFGPSGLGQYNRDYGDCKKVGSIYDKLASILYLSEDLQKYAKEMKNDKRQRRKTGSTPI